MKKIYFIGAASGWGAQNKFVEEGPIYFFQKYFAENNDKLNNNQVIVNSKKIIYPDKTYVEKKIELDFDNTEKLVLGVCQRITEEVYNAIVENNFPIVIGGDHSLAMGSWNGLAKAKNSYGKLGLIWIDAHMDSHTKETSLSKAIHGMPLSFLMSQGDSLYKSELFNNLTVIAPENLILIGVRSYEKDEKKLLEKLGVKIFYIDEVLTHGFNAIFHYAIECLMKNNITSLGLSLDIDVFDPIYAPGTGSKEKNGINPEEFFNLFNDIKIPEVFDMFEIMEYNPKLDINLVTYKLLKNIINNCVL